MRVECACGKFLKVSDDLAGKKVRCPACGGSVLVEEPILDVTEAAAIPRPARGKSKPLPEPEEDFVDQEHLQPKKRKGKTQPSFLSLYGLYLGIGGGAVAIAAIVLVIIFTRAKPEEKKDP